MGLQNSRIILSHHIKMDRNYNNVLSYNEQQVLSICQKNIIAEGNDYSFIRQDKNVISVPFNFPTCIQANYIAFQNTDYSAKWFFAWIDEVEYRNDGCTYLHYTIDVWSTWHDWWQAQPCFVVREHTNNDTIR